LKNCKDVTRLSPFSNGIHDVGMLGGWISWHPNDPCHRVSSSPWGLAYTGFRPLIEFNRLYCTTLCSHLPKVTIVVQLFDFLMNCVIPDFSSKTMVLKTQGFQNLLFLIFQRTCYFDFFSSNFTYKGSLQGGFVPRLEIWWLYYAMNFLV
jgi:hypothetical protein